MNYSNVNIQQHPAIPLQQHTYDMNTENCQNIKGNDAFELNRMSISPAFRGSQPGNEKKIFGYTAQGTRVRYMSIID